jgi:hypothetical protein
MNGRSMLSIGVMPLGPAVSDPPKSLISWPLDATCPMVSPNAKRDDPDVRAT